MCHSVWSSAPKSSSPLGEKACRPQIGSGLRTRLRCRLARAAAALAGSRRGRSAIVRTDGRLAISISTHATRSASASGGRARRVSIELAIRAVEPTRKTSSAGTESRRSLRPLELGSTHLSWPRPAVGARVSEGQPPAEKQKRKR